MPSQSNILIIGGGAIGLCSAYYLARSGACVTVIDQGEMGHGSSLHNAGYVCPSHFVPLAAPGVFKQGLKWMLNPTSPLYIKPRLDFDFLAWAWCFSKACNESVMRKAMPLLRDLLLDSSRLYEALVSGEGLNVEFKKNGLTVLYYSEKGKHSVEHEAKLADEVGIEARLMDQRRLHEFDPQIEFRAHGGIYFPGDAHLVPAKLVQNLAAHLEHKGVNLVRQCKVKKIIASGDKVSEVQTDKGTFQADEFVLAGGAWSPLLVRDLGMQMHLQAGKGYSVTVKRPPVIPRIPYIFQERRVAVTPFSDSLRFAGTMELAGIDVSLNKPRIEAILNAIPLYFANVARPQSSDGELWGGLRPVTPDGLPYIGRFRKYRNLVAATGHAMLGISLATVTGKLVTEILTQQQPSHDLALLNPDRYN
ncbi:MAG: FAD-dependent oxidoreductase [Ignavibacteriales bacterium]|nr:FAD-dependent oxidoreductase [Ignavibacteriales bacterium]